MPSLRNYQGPPLFSYGFRPFFFFGSVYAGAAILVWLPTFYGQIEIPITFAPRDWHIHEMLFGYVAAVIGGFLLTAVPNWTGRLPLQGGRLAILFSIWVSGRLAVCASTWLGWAAAMAIDGAFLVLLAAAAAREIIAGRKWGNLAIVVIVSLLAADNLAFHIEAHQFGLAEYSSRAGIAIIVLVTVIGGRIIPSFTRNWLAKGVRAGSRRRSAASILSLLDQRESAWRFGSPCRSIELADGCSASAVCCTLSGCPAGRDIGPSPIVSYSSCTSLTYSYQLASF